VVDRHPKVNRMNEVIYDRKAAIRNTTLYGIAFLVALAILVTRRSVLGYALGLLLGLWAIGGLKANVRAIRCGFRDLG
jgi:hypothetical protein